MNKQLKEARLDIAADGNVTRLAKSLLNGPANVRHQITHAFRQLNKHTYVKDLTMSEVLEALRMISDKEI